MVDREKVIKDIEDGVLMARATSTRFVHLYVDKAEEIVELLKEQKEHEPTLKEWTDEKRRVIMDFCNEAHNIAIISQVTEKAIQPEVLEKAIGIIQDLLNGVAKDTDYDPIWD